MAFPEIRDASADGVVRVEAWDADALVGHATARPVQLFECERFCEVQVDGARRREGIGTALWTALDGAVPPEEALVCRLLHADTDAVGFAGSIGPCSRTRSHTSSASPVRVPVRLSISSESALVRSDSVSARRWVRPAMAWSKA